MKITGGEQFDDAQLIVEATAPEGSSSEMNFGDQFDRSKRSIKFTELPASIDMSELAKELAKLGDGMREQNDPAKSGEIEAIDAAHETASKGDRSQTAAYLAKAGHWALDTATKIGIPVAIEAIKQAMY